MMKNKNKLPAQDSKQLSTIAACVFAPNQYDMGMLLMSHHPMHNLLQIFLAFLPTISNSIMP